MEEEDDDDDDSGSLLYQTETETIESNLKKMKRRNLGKYLISWVITDYEANDKKSHVDWQTICANTSDTVSQSFIASV